MFDMMMQKTKCWRYIMVIEREEFTEFTKLFTNFEVKDMPDNAIICQNIERLCYYIWETLKRKA